MTYEFVESPQSYFILRFLLVAFHLRDFITPIC